MPRRRQFADDAPPAAAGGAAGLADPEGRPLTGGTPDEASAERMVWSILGVITLAALLLPKLVR